MLHKKFEIRIEQYVVRQQKEIKNASECIVELYKHAGIFKNTREGHREGRGAAECS